MGKNDKAKQNKTSPGNVMYRIVTIVNNTIIYIYIAKRLDLKSFRHKKKKM